MYPNVRTPNSGQYAVAREANALLGNTDIPAVVPAQALPELTQEAEEVIVALSEIQHEQHVTLFHTEAQLQIREAQYVRASEATRVARRELESFQEQVRDAFLELHEAGDLEDDQVDEILENLDLPGRKRKYVVTVKVYQEIEVEVEATSEDEAQDEVENQDTSSLIDEHGDSYGWELDVRYVNQA